VVVEDYPYYDLLDLEPVNPGLESFPKLTFQDGEYRFNLISLMILFLIECISESSSIISGDPFTFSFSDRDQELRVSRINSWISSESYPLSMT